MHCLVRWAICAVIAVPLTAAESFEVVNVTGRLCETDPLRLPFAVPAQGAYAVTRDGEPVLHQLVIDGDVRQLWVMPQLERGAAASFALEQGVAAPEAEPRVTIERAADSLVLRNERLALRLPAVAAGDAPPPILGVEPTGGSWRGAGVWQTDRECTGFTATVLADGRLFARVRLRYDFAGTAGIDQQTPAFAEIDVTLLPGRPYAIIEERHAMPPGSFWEFDCAAGWAPEASMVRIHGDGPDGRAGVRAREHWSLQPGQTRMGEVLVKLIPRWNQHFDDGWFYAARDDADALGALVVRAGRWTWPHDNWISVRLAADGATAALRCPTRRGSRYWLLVAAPVEALAVRERDDGGKRRRVDGIAGLVTEQMQSLDKLAHHFITAWPGRKVEHAFSGLFPFNDRINPTGFWRQQARQAVREAGKKTDRVHAGHLSAVQAMFDPDLYGTYWQYWSPENPNFFTDFIKRPFAQTANLVDHPRFAQLARLAEFKLREDLYHSVTLPGGAGQECPGYLAHALGAWLRMAQLADTHLGFDPFTWPRVAAAARFLVASSQPDGAGGRRIHPGGDTHPPGTEVVALADRLGVEVDIAGLTSAEYPGFGAILRHRPGTARETYVAFKAGPNRGHYHGDQLSIHQAFAATPQAVDHMCSYAPRAGQEHMHNRVSFSSATYAHANMDGYERLIAFRSTPEVDIAIGQVESNRLRQVTPLPPEVWDQRWEVEPLAEPLRYRRTLVLVKGASDYLVIRDQFAGPELTATYNLHVRGQTAQREGGHVAFDGLQLVMVGGEELTFDRLDWGYTRGDKWSEHTRGVRFSQTGTTGEFISVLIPADMARPAVTAIAGGVRVGNTAITFGGGIDQEPDITYVTAGDVTLTGADLDLDRSQGEIGLFVPDAGYPFGELPSWLIRQRAARPDWYAEYRRDLGPYWAP